MGSAPVAYILLSVSLPCPFCNKTSVERLIAETGRFDQDELAGTLSQQVFECSYCLRTLPRGTQANAHAELATASQLTELGFDISRPN